MMLMCGLAAGSGSSLALGLLALVVGIAGGDFELGGAAAFTIVIWTSTASVPAGLIVSAIAVPILERSARVGRVVRFVPAALFFWGLSACLVIGLTYWLDGDAVLPFLLFAAPGATAAGWVYHIGVRASATASAQNAATT